jgi:hypothetical protein
MAEKNTPSLRAKFMSDNERYYALKLVLDEISSIVCVSGQNEFNGQLDTLKFYLQDLKKGKALAISSKLTVPSSNNDEEVVNEIEEEFLPNAVSEEDECESSSSSSCSSSSSNSCSSLPDILDQIDHPHLNDENAQDYLNFAVLKGSKVKFGNFASRGGMVGNKDPKRPRINEDGSQRPSSGPGSRGGKGGYNKKFKSTE